MLTYFSSSTNVSQLPPASRRPNRSRSNTTTSYRNNAAQIDEDPEEDSYAASPSNSYNPASELRPPPSFISRSRTNSNQNSPRRELPGFDLPVQTSQQRPTISSRSNTVGTFEGPMSYQGSRDASPAGMPRLSRVPTDSSATIALGRSNLRPVKRADSNTDVFGDPDLDGDDGERSVSPGSYNSGRENAYSRSASWSVQGGYANGGSSNGGAGYSDDGGRKKNPPPPPPPSRYV